MGLALQVTSSYSQDLQDGLTIAKQADKADLGFESSQVKMEMVLRNKQGQESIRLMETRTLELIEDGDKSLILFNSPRDVKGTATLTYTHKDGPDDQWLFLPAVKRVKRISSDNKSGPFSCLLVPDFDLYRQYGNHCWQGGDGENKGCCHTHRSNVTQVMKRRHITAIHT